MAPAPFEADRRAGEQITWDCDDPARFEPPFFKCSLVLALASF